MNSPRMKHKSSLSMQAASPNSKIYALNTQIHHARQSNNQLRQLVQEKQHVLRRTKAKSDALRCNLNSLHRETLRTTSNHAKNTKATSISSKQCVTLQHKSPRRGQNLKRYARPRNSWSVKSSKKNTLPSNSNACLSVSEVILSNKCVCWPAKNKYYPA